VLVTFNERGSGKVGQTF